jgi:hypothetical protein
MFFVALAATALLAAADASATPAPAETAAQPVAAAPAQPKTRKVCYVDPAATGSRMAHKVCRTEVVKDDSKAPDAPKTEQK